MARLTSIDGQRDCDLRGLRIFLAVGASGSMTAAAQRLGLTQSAVSQTIRQLEEFLGTILVDRSQRPLALTATGLVLQRNAQRVIEEADALRNAVRSAGVSKMSELRVGAVDSFASTAGPSLIKALLKTTATRLSFRSGLAHDHAQGLLGRSLDIIITTDALDDVDGLDRYPIIAEPFVLLLPEKLTAGSELSGLKRLAATHSLIRFSGRSHIGGQIERHLRRLNIRVARLLEVDATDTLVAMVAAELGWAIATPLCLLQVRGQLTKLRAQPFPGTGFARQLYLITRTGEYGDLPQRIANLACEALRRECLPELKRAMPWLKGQVVIG